MTGEKALVAVFGIGLAVVGYFWQRLSRRGFEDAIARDLPNGIRINLQTGRIVGWAFVALGISLVLGAGVGALFWP